MSDQESLAAVEQALGFTAAPIDKTPSEIKPAKAIVEIFIAMNENGDAEVAMTPANAVARLERNCGGILRRLVKRTYLMTPPVIIRAADIEDVPDDAGETAAIPFDTAWALCGGMGS